MSNSNQCKTQTTGLDVMIGRCPLDSQHGGVKSVLRMLAVLISGKIKIKAIQLRDTNRTNELEKTTKMKFIILKAILYKSGIEKGWWKFGPDLLDLIQAKDWRTKLEWY